MDEAKTKPAGKKAIRKNGNSKPAGRSRKAAPIEPGFTPSLSSPAPPEGSPARESAAASPSRSISPEERHRLIAEAAYYRASQRGFMGGAEVEDWLAAEAEVDNKLIGR